MDKQAKSNRSHQGAHANGGGQKPSVTEGHAIRFPGQLILNFGLWLMNRIGFP